MKKTLPCISRYENDFCSLLAVIGENDVLAKWGRGLRIPFAYCLMLGTVYSSFSKTLAVIE